MELTLGSLFDGISGFPLAGARLGIKTLWGSEIEPFPMKVSTIRFPDMKQEGDITKIDGSKLKPVDIVTGGSPCQDLSVAGKRAGLAGERSGLYMEQIRIVREMRERDRKTGKPIRPRFMVWENVPGAFSSNGGEDFRAVLEETARIADETVTIPRPPGGKWDTCGAIVADGWSIAWRVLDAQYWGVPQRRRRIFLVADFGGQSAPEILFKRPGLQRHIAEGEEKGEGAAADTERSAGKTGGGAYCIQGNCIDRADTAGCNGKGWTEDVCYTLNTIDRPAVCAIDSNCQDSRFKLTGQVVPTIPAKAGTGGNNGPMLAVQCIEPGALSRGQGESVCDKCPTLRAEMGDNHPAVATYQKTTGPLMANSHPGSYTGQDAYTDMLVAGCDFRNDKENGDLCGTLQAKPNGGYSYNCIHPVRVGYTVRRLTPLECERLQDFPDGWTDIEGASDSARYKALGNSLAVVCAEYVLEGIKSLL